MPVRMHVKGVVEFRCVFTRGHADPRWLINDTSLFNFMMDGGIIYDETAITENETQYITFRIRPTAENNETSLQCRVF